ncbi:16675_t:CDS:10 [Entrophospora sp. SA101]|nr:16675_t:CDS:10 [Entrophospora sp. SA101]
MDELLDEIPLEPLKINQLVSALKNGLKSSQHSVSYASLTCISPLISSIAVTNTSYLKYVITALAPAVIGKLGDTKKKMQEASLQVLLAMWRFSNGAVHNLHTLNALETCIKESAFCHKQWRVPWTTNIVKLLDDSNERVREAAKNKIVILFSDMPSNAKIDLKRELEKHSIRAGIIEFIYSKVIIEPFDDLSNSKSVLFSKKSKIVDKPQIDNVDDFEQELQKIIPIFQGKETELNWSSREKYLNHLKSLINADQDLKYPEVFASFLKIIMDGVISSLTSLRTALNLTTCEFIQDTSVYLGSAINPFAETLLTKLLKMVSSTKKLVSQASANATISLLKNSSYNCRLVTQLLSTMKEKNVQLRIYNISFLKTVIEAHSHRKDYIERTGGAEVFEKSIKIGLVDASPKVREGCREVFWLFNEFWSHRGDKIMKNLEPQVLKQLGCDKLKEDNNSSASASTAIPSQKMPPPSPSQQSSYRSNTPSSSHRSSIASIYRPTTPSTNRPTTTYRPTTPSSNRPTTTYRPTTPSSNRPTTTYRPTTPSSNRLTYRSTTPSPNRPTTPSTYRSTTPSPNRQTTTYRAITPSPKRPIMAAAASSSTTNIPTMTYRPSTPSSHRPTQISRPVTPSSRSQADSIGSVNGGSSNVGGYPRKSSIPRSESSMSNYSSVMSEQSNTTNNTNYYNSNNNEAIKLNNDLSSPQLPSIMPRSIMPGSNLLRRKSLANLTPPLNCSPTNPYNDNNNRSSPPSSPLKYSTSFNNLKRVASFSNLNPRSSPSYYATGDNTNNYNYNNKDEGYETSEDSINNNHRIINNNVIRSNDDRREYTRFVEQNDGNMPQFSSRELMNNNNNNSYSINGNSNNNLYRTANYGENPNYPNNIYKNLINNQRDNYNRQLLPSQMENPTNLDRRLLLLKEYDSNSNNNNIKYHEGDNNSNNNNSNNSNIEKSYAPRENYNDQRDRQLLQRKFAEKGMLHDRETYHSRDNNSKNNDDILFYKENNNNYDNSNNNSSSDYYNNNNNLNPPKENIIKDDDLKMPLSPLPKDQPKKIFLEEVKEEPEEQIVRIQEAKEEKEELVKYSYQKQNKSDLSLIEKKNVGSLEQEQEVITVNNNNIIINSSSSGSDNDNIKLKLGNEHMIMYDDNNKIHNKINSSQSDIMQEIQPVNIITSQPSNNPVDNDLNQSLTNNDDDNNNNKINTKSERKGRTIDLVSIQKKKLLLVTSLARLCNYDADDVLFYQLTKLSNETSELSNEIIEEIWEYGERFREIMSALITYLSHCKSNNLESNEMALKLLGQLIVNQSNYVNGEKDVLKDTYIQIVDSNMTLYLLIDIMETDLFNNSDPFAIPDSDSNNVSKNVCSSSRYSVKGSAFVVLTKLVEKIDKNILKKQIGRIIPLAVKGFNDSRSEIRKSAVESLVAIYSILGNDNSMFQYLGVLNRLQRNLLAYYFSKSLKKQRKLLAKLSV